jgi:hypothetical protein
LGIWLAIYFTKTKKQAACKKYLLHLGIFFKSYREKFVFELLKKYFTQKGNRISKAAVMLIKNI